MAQQLATLRTPQAYEGVSAYARRHTGDAAAAAYLALGHAYLLDHRYSEAVENFRLAREDSQELVISPISWPLRRITIRATMPALKLCCMDSRRVMRTAFL